MVKQALNDNGACVALRDVLKAGSIKGSEAENALLKPLLDAVNAQSNSVFLDKAVNAEVSGITYLGVYNNQLITCTRRNVLWSNMHLATIRTGQHRLH